MCPILGTTKIENLNQNIGALSVELTREEMAELESYAFARVVKGGSNSRDFSTLLHVLDVVIIRCPVLGKISN